MPARKKPPGLRSPNSRPAGLSVVASAGPGALPAELREPSDGWQPETVEAWAQYWQSELPTPAPTDLPALRRLFDLRDQRVKMQQALDASDFLIEGSQGQPVVNPLVKAIADTDGRILALEDRFFLTAASRLKAGVKTVYAAAAFSAVNEAMRQPQPAAERPRPAAVDPRFGQVIDIPSEPTAPTGA